MRGLGALQVLVLLHCCISAAAKPRDPGRDADLLPGWRSETYRQQPVANKKPYMEVLHEEARIFLFHNFLSEAECDHIVRKAEPRLARSGVVDSDSGGNAVSNVRTSNGMFFDRGEDSVIADVEERIARWTLLPVGNGEGLQVLRYNLNQKYDAHWDYFFHKDGTSNGGNRYATVLMYLSDVEEGGETVFPNVPAPADGRQDSFSECAREHLAVRPRKGDAVLFHSIKPNGELEPRSMHGACPVIRGTKWSMAKWIHVGHWALHGELPEEIKQHVLDEGPNDCHDKDINCASWASIGECEKNSGFMIGTRAQPGACLKSCNRCDLAQPANANASGGSGGGSRVRQGGNRKFGTADF